MHKEHMLKEVRNILLSPPQLVCYTRILLACIAVFIFHAHPFISMSLMIVAELLDMLDGYLARKLNQISNFGAIIDMITDRLSPICTCLIIVSLAPSWSAILTLFLALDLISHMAMLYSALLSGSSENHKKCLVKTTPILTLYYAPSGKKRCFMVLTIVFYYFAQIFWMIYLISPSYMPYPLLLTFTALGAIKVYIHILHLYYSLKLSLPATLIEDS